MDRRGIGDEANAQARGMVGEIPDIGANLLPGLGGEAIEGGREVGRRPAPPLDA